MSESVDNGLILPGPPSTCCRRGVGGAVPRVRGSTGANRRNRARSPSQKPRKPQNFRTHSDRGVVNGTLLTQIRAPLGLGTLTLKDGRSVAGFLREAYVAKTVPDITELGSWPAYLETA
jgi:hypothetical protein